MLFLFVAGFIAILAGLAFARYAILKARRNDNDWIAGGMIFTTIAVIVVMIGFVVSGVAWSDQKQQNRSLRQ